MLGEACGGLFLEARLSAPWCIASRFALEDFRPFLPHLSQLIGYHVVLDGSMLVTVGDGPPVEARAGEIVILPHSNVHTLASARGLVPVSTADLIQRSPEGRLMKIEHGGKGAETSIVCGFLGTESRFNPLLSALPALLRVDLDRATSREWIESSVRFAAEELARGRLASSNVVSRLSEVLLVEAVREYVSDLGDSATGWLRGLTDPKIGRALARLHVDLSAPWTIETLAKEAALSRSAFVERFTAAVGLPPMRYLTRWRLESAKRQLAESTMSVAQVAHAVGYESEEGFRRAFQRAFGISPADWRAAR